MNINPEADKHTYDFLARRFKDNKEKQTYILIEGITYEGISQATNTEKKNEETQKKKI